MYTDLALNVGKFLWVRRISIIAVTVSLLSPLFGTSSASAVSVSNTQVEVALSRAGYPVGRVNGFFDQKTRRALCAWRDLTGQRASRNYPTPSERVLLVQTTHPVPTRRLALGLNVSRTCQALTWVRENPTTKARYIQAIFEVSTGMATHPTPKGLFKIYSQFNGWQESKLYPGAMMYRPKYFYHGYALHGSATDALVHTYPASHGCTRMLHRSIDQLWTNKVGIGTQVFIYGDWLG